MVWEGPSESGFDTCCFISRRIFFFAKILRAKFFSDQVKSKTESDGGKSN